MKYSQDVVIGALLITGFVFAWFVCDGYKSPSQHKLDQIQAISIEQNHCLNVLGDSTEGRSKCAAAFPIPEFP